MSYIKVYSPEIANIVGIQAASLLSHIKYWCESCNVEKMYRTNKQLSSDFEGSLSESQIQRCKKKLLDAGLIQVSHDLGHTRTTHYKLTEKAKNLLGMIVSTVKKVAVKAKEVASKAVKNKKHNPVLGFNLKEALKQAKVKPTEQEIFNEEQEDDHDYDEHFKALDIAMLQCKKDKIEDLKFTDILDKAFKKIPNIDLLENKRKMMDDVNHFKEEY